MSTHQLTEFGRELSDAMHALRMSQEGLAAAIGKNQSSVSAWCLGERSPAPHKVFEVEHVLRLAPGQLSRHLGYVPPARNSISAEEAISADRSISTDVKIALLAIIRSYRTGDITLAQPSSELVDHGHELSVE